MVVLMSGCATMGTAALEGVSTDWPPIGTLKADLIKDLGQPQSSTHTMTDGNTHETLTWVYAHAETNPALFIPIVGLFVAASGNGMTGNSQSLAVTLDTEGKVISRSWSQTKIGKSVN
jgi:hypothetical protein